MIKWKSIQYYKSLEPELFNEIKACCAIVLLNFFLLALGLAVLFASSISISITIAEPLAVAVGCSSAGVLISTTTLVTKFRELSDRVNKRELAVFRKVPR